MTAAERNYLSGPARLVIAYARKLPDDRRRLRHLCEFLRPHLTKFTRPIVPIAVDRIDRTLSGTALAAHHIRAVGLLRAFDWSQETFLHGLLGQDLFAAARALGEPPTQHVEQRFPMLRDVERQAALLRDILGNPFRPVKCDPSWRTSASVGLAETMYGSRDFAAASILADALEEAGCEQPELLAHLRDPGLTHVRGCWAVDLVLGKS